MGKFFEALQKSDENKELSEDATKADLDADIGQIKSKIPANDSSTAISNYASETDWSQRANDGIKVAMEAPDPALEGEAVKHELSLDRIDKNLISYHDPHSLEAEQFRMLRTSILFPAEGNANPRTILVTSALPGEGKSFVASNLAYTISQNIDKHVLLIDCDMRHPSIHEIFGYKSVPGLSNYLTGDYALPNLLLKTPNPRLSILAGGPVPSNPAELISSNRMSALLREVRSRYDDRYIILDSPPPHLTAESKALGQFVDGIIIVVGFGRTNREVVSQLIEKFNKEKIIGVVANWLDRQASPFYGSGKYNHKSYYETRQ